MGEGEGEGAEDGERERGGTEGKEQMCIEQSCFGKKFFCKELERKEVFQTQYASL